MPLHLQREIDKLKTHIFLLSDMVKKNMEDAVRSIANRDMELARQVHESDDRIDRQEVDIEEECLKILALYQPVAIDLRFLIALLKINNELERIGDEAANISARSIYINSQPPLDLDIDFSGITERVKRMVDQSLDALVNMDEEEAHRVRRADDDLDRAVHTVFVTLKAKVRRDPEKVDLLIEYMRIFRYLERIGDHATNIAEDVIYMTGGEIVRHIPEG
ncbi:MAG: phosphate signaling complex protein PhoU [Candidatus Omnitrophota bacterium]